MSTEPRRYFHRSAAREVIAVGPIWVSSRFKRNSYAGCDVSAHVNRFSATAGPSFAAAKAAYPNDPTDRAVSFFMAGWKTLGEIDEAEYLHLLALYQEEFAKREGS